MGRWKHALGAIGTVVFLVGCGSGSGAAGPRTAASRSASAPILSQSVSLAPTSVAAVGSSWTIMVFSNSDNNIEADQVAAVNAMETVGSTAAVSVVVQIQTKTIPFGAPLDTQAKRLFIQKDGDPTRIGSPTIEALGDVDGTSPAAIAQFVGWARQNYPAQHYALILSDHGGAWTGFGQDDVNNTTGSVTKLAQLVTQSGQALGQRFDIFGFDTCLNAAIEVQSLLAPVAAIGIGCEESVPASWNYSQFLADLAANPEMDARTLAKAIVTRTGSFTHSVNADESTETGNVNFQMSALDLDKLPAVVTAFQDFTSRNRASLASLLPTLEIARARSLSFWKPDQHNDVGYMVDLGDFASQLSLAHQDPALPAIRAAIADAVILEVAGRLEQRATGISIFWPAAAINGSLDWGSYGNYSTTAFAQATGWDQYLNAFWTTTSALTQNPSPPIVAPPQPATGASPAAPLELAFTVDTKDTAALGAALLCSAGSSAQAFIGTFDLAPGATSATWDGTALVLTAGSQTSFLDWQSIIPGAGLYTADVQLSGSQNLATSQATVAVSIDSTGTPTLMGIYYVWPDKVAQTNSFEAAPASDLVGATLTPVIRTLDASGNFAAPILGDSIPVAGMALAKTAVPSGSYTIAIQAIDYASNLGVGFASVTIP
jgi:hypothetical protein